MKAALFYKKSDDMLQCVLCPRKCIISIGQTGLCGVRKNISGSLYSLVYGKACSASIDPIEKKPFFHFAPGSSTLSIATVGCTLKCKFCQNWEISQAKEIIGESLSPEEIIKLSKNAEGISWTYTEPTVFFEYFFDTASLSKNIYNTWISNGYTNPEPIKKAAKFVDAVNIDYKGTENLYSNLCLAHLEPVRMALKQWKKAGVWIEITNLLIPGHNDSEEQIKEMCNWIFENLGQVPLHFSRFFPVYKLTNTNPTDMETLEKAVKIAEDAGFHYVYMGNVQNPKENTYCHNCKELVIERVGYIVVKFNLLKKGKNYDCPACGTKIPLAGMQWSSLKE